MSSAAEATEVFNCTPDEFFSIVADYEKYSEFLPEVKQSRVLQVEGNKKLVEYEISVIKTITYSLWLTEERPNLVSWDLAGGDIFKTCSGHWKIEPEADRTRATYRVEASFGMFVPKAITKSLLTMNLPNMMSAYKKRVSEIYGK